MHQMLEVDDTGSYIPLRCRFDGGYTPPKLSGIEGEIEALWDSDRFRARQLIRVWVRRRAEANAQMELFDDKKLETTIALLLEETDELVLKCSERGHSAFAAVEELRSHLAERNLLD